MNRSGPPSLRNDLESELRSLATVWFPRSLDLQYGGFLCEFDYRWKPRGSQPKMLEYQARQTIAAARLAAHSEDFAFLREVASHGFSYLKDKVWDHKLGGWYRLLDRTGVPREGATKHGHGMSYAISACVACYRTIGDPECLELARLAFTWLEEHAHDSEHGGYFGFYRQDGTPILTPDEGLLQSGQNCDPIGTPIGFKDANTTSDLLGSFSDLFRVWPDPLLKKRLDETMRVVRDRLVVAPGMVHMFVSPDWIPLPDFLRYGQTLRSANLLLSASEALSGTVDVTTERVAKSMVDTMLRIAWDRNQGGFHYAGSSTGPMYLEDTLIFTRNKIWWAQAEGLKALSTMAQLHPGDEHEYAKLFARLWEYVKKYLVDSKRGGWLPAGLDTNPEASRRPKASAWKDASHEIDALLHSVLLLPSS
jgi:mannobiose 2-epimerase